MNVVTVNSILLFTLYIGIYYIYLNDLLLASHLPALGEGRCHSKQNLIGQKSGVQDESSTK